MKKYKVMIENIETYGSLPHWANLIYDKEITITSEKDLTFDEILSRVYDELEVFADTPDVWEGEYELEISVEEMRDA